MPLFLIDWDGQEEDIDIVEEKDRFYTITNILEKWLRKQKRHLHNVATFIVVNGGHPIIPEDQVNDLTPLEVLKVLTMQALTIIVDDTNLEDVFLTMIGVRVESVDTM